MIIVQFTLLTYVASFWRCLAENSRLTEDPSLTKQRKEKISSDKGKHDTKAKK